MKIVKIVSILIFFSCVSVNAQIIRSKLDVVGGVAAREYFHLGLRYQYTDITQLSFAIGNDLELQDEKITTYTIDHLIHFGQLSFQSNRPVWYARQGLTFSKNFEGENRTRKFTYINLGLGREFSVNSWLGFNADLGVVWQVYSVKEENQSVIKDNLRQLFPLARVQAFISF